MRKLSSLVVLVAQSLNRVQPFVTPWTVATRLLCPWGFPGKNTGVGCHVLLQGIFLSQELNLSLLHWQAGSLPLSHQGRPRTALQYLMTLRWHSFFWACCLNSEKSRQLVEKILGKTIKTVFCEICFYCNLELVHHSGNNSQLSNQLHCSLQAVAESPCGKS